MTQGAPATRRTILVVDDDRDIRETLQEILEQEGFPVATARNGVEALVYLRCSPRPGLVLLDLSMPVMDGAAFCAERLKDPALVQIPVIAFSASANLREKTRALSVAGFLRKPPRLDELLATARRFCDPAAAS